MEKKLFHSINQFSRHFSKSLNEILVPLGLYSGQWPIIYRLYTNGECSQAELSTYLGVEAPTMTRTLIRMEKSGWIKKEQGKDKREKKINLTEKAIGMYPVWTEAINLFEERILQNCTENEIHTIFTIIEKMRANL